ncbi:HD domain-containing protein [Thermococcus barossii]|uniref:Hydrolase n=1 Tax=Thermococcus barossii TaxID=54077 RepID=A0A2Z2MCP5_9EURY|nr:HD domain-containing protein [Thermococcus barossii]ASJ04247.1 hydrolase [Thermococcus barossii]
MSACAYFTNGECVETMEAHVKRGFEIIEGLYIDRGYERFLANLLNVDDGTAVELLRKAYALHDAGKCLGVFQNRKSSFGFHEFYSYLIVGKVFQKFGKAGEVASVAVLLHHHSWIRTKTPEKQANLRLSGKCRELLENLSREKLPEEVPWIEPTVAYSKAEEILRKNLRGVYALLLPIVVADNYAAAINRGGESSALGREIFDVLRVRGWEVARGVPGGV